MTKLSEKVHVKDTFLRSINISQDYNKSDWLDNYVISPLVIQSLFRICDSLDNQPTERAFALTGPFGTGKSSFGVFLTQLFLNRQNKAWDLLKKKDPVFAETLHSKIWQGEGDYLVVPVTCRRTTIGTLLKERFKELKKQLKLKIKFDGNNVLEDLKTLVEYASKNRCRGVLFVFDELGKVFEEAYYHKQDSDIELLQEIAEIATRSADFPILLLGILHQSFGNYVENTRDTQTRDEFRKIEGRFATILFTETTAAQIQLLKNSFEKRKKQAVSPSQNLINAAIDLNLPATAGLTDDVFKECVRAVFPIHPLTLLVLPLLFRKFGQNERSIFTYLTSNEPGGFQDFLKNNEIDSFLRLSDLYDYFINNYEMQLGSTIQGKILLEANGIIRSKDLTLEEQSVVKTVAILTSLANQINLPASEEILHFALPELPKDIFKKLQKKSILNYRRYKNSYTVWEGSDLDLEDCYAKAEEALCREELSIASVLEQTVNQRPMIAKRHSFETGTFRYFEVSYVDTHKELDQKFKKYAEKENNASGIIFICFPQNQEEIELLTQHGKSYTQIEPSVLLAIPHNIDLIRDIISEARCLKWIQKNIKELRNDRIVSREIDIRMAEVQKQINQIQIQLIEPCASNMTSRCTWIAKGSEQHFNNSREVSIFLSELCNQLYPKSPRILNEMINKRKISSQIAAARNFLIKSLIDPEKRKQEFLGIDGFPPERSIYEGLLRVSGLHRKSGDHWELAAPENSNKVKLYPCWQCLEEMVFNVENVPIAVDKLYKTLRAKPYGLTDGVLPIIITIFYLVNQDEITLYQEGSFIPDPIEAHFELLVRRPDLFAFAGARIQGIRKTIVARFAKGFNTKPFIPAIIHELYRRYISLPKYTKTTNQVSPTTIQFRQTIENAKCPESLLFVELPKIFDLPVIKDTEMAEEILEKFFQNLNKCFDELDHALPELIKKQRQILLEKFGLPNTPEGWKKLCGRATSLIPKVTDGELLQFLKSIISTQGDWKKADGVIGFMVSKPVSHWGTLDIQNFPRIAEAKANLFSETFAAYSNVEELLTPEKKKKMATLKKQIWITLEQEKDDQVRRSALWACLKQLGLDK